MANSFIGEMDTNEGGLVMAKVVLFKDDYFTKGLEVVVFNYKGDSSSSGCAIYTRIHGNKKPPKANYLLVPFTDAEAQQKWFDNFGETEATEYLQGQENMLKEQQRKGLIIKPTEQETKQVLKGSYKLPSSLSKKR